MQENDKTLQGRKIIEKVYNGTVTIVGAAVKGRKGEATNGVVRSLNAVLSLN